MRLPSELYYYSGDCPDNATLLEIKENFLIILSSVNKLYNRICPNNFTCTVDRVSVDCGPVLARTRRDVKLAMQQDGQLKHNHHVNKREESHAVVFRFDIVTTFGDENDTFDDAYDATENLQELQKEEFSRLIQNGTFDIEGLLLRPDSFQPAEYADLACEPGTILYGTTCSKPRSIFFYFGSPEQTIFMLSYCVLSASVVDKLRHHLLQQNLVDWLHEQSSGWETKVDPNVLNR